MKQLIEYFMSKKKKQNRRKEIDDLNTEKVLEVIRKHLGKTNPIMVSEIMEYIGLTDREIRKVVQLLVNEFHYAIGSTTKGPYGFFMVVSFEDYLEAVQNLHSRQLKIQERIESLKKACAEEGIELPDIEIKQDKAIFNIHNSIIIYL